MYFSEAPSCSPPLALGKSQALATYRKREVGAVYKDCGKRPHLQWMMIVAWACMNVELSGYLQERALFYFVVFVCCCPTHGRELKTYFGEQIRPKT